jgi:hypothetical protein
MRPDVLTIVHAPLHGPTADAATIRRACSFGGDSIGFTEAYEPQTRRAIRARLRHRLVVGKSATDPRRGPWDVPILVHRRNPLERGWAIKACDASTPVKIAPERWLTGAIYDHRFGLIEHIAAHPNAAIDGQPPDLDRVLKYRENMRRLESRIMLAQRNGRTVVVTGDLNYPAGGPWWAPEAVFRRCDLDTWRVGIDWVAWAPHLRLRRRDVLAGPDHPWLVAGFAL